MNSRDHFNKNNQNNKYNKKVALITGASSGIGAAAAMLLAQNNYNIVINYNNNETNALEIYKQISNNNNKHITIKADISDDKDIKKLFATIDEVYGKIDLLVNNAGITGGRLAAEDITPELLYKVYATNTFSTILCCTEAIKRMKVNNSGNIINISSEAAIHGGNQLSHYASSKAAINTYTKALAREIAQYNIRVNAISPGIVDTNMHNNNDKIKLNNSIKNIPMQRMGSSEEVAEAILFLASSKSSYISGSILSVNGAR